MTDQQNRPPTGQQVEVVPTATVVAVAGGVVESLRSQPIMLVVVILNCIMVGFAAWAWNTSELSRHKEWTQIIDRCMGPSRATTSSLGGSEGDRGGETKSDNKETERNYQPDNWYQNAAW